MKKRCLILVNAYSRLKSSLNQSQRLKEEFALLGVVADVRNNDYFACYVDDGGALACRDKGGYDFCVYLDKDKYCARMLEKSGLRLFNSAEAVEVCDDKMLTSIALSDGGVAMPRTLPGLLCYNPEEEVKPAALDEVARSLGFPLIVKCSYGSLGSGVFKADDRAALSEIAEQLKCTPHLFQRFVPESAGRDARVIVIGGRTVAAMKRVSGGDFRSNLELGGSGYPIEADEKLRALCERTASILGLDYCGVDVLFGKDGYLVCEVNSNAFFGGMERVTGINVARAYARYICGEIYGKL